MAPNTLLIATLSGRSEDRGTGAAPDWALCVDTVQQQPPESLNKHIPIIGKAQSSDTGADKWWLGSSLEQGKAWEE